MKSRNMKTINEFLVKKHQKITMEFVDLGLPSGTKWASCNLGAKSPEEFGDLFAWGEVKAKEKFNKENYKFSKYEKYNHDDNLDILDNEDDAAYVMTNGDAVMPTKNQYIELRNYTELESTDDYENTGVKGIIIKSQKNNNHIFIPIPKIGNISFWLKNRDSAPSYALHINCEYYPKDKYYNGVLRMYCAHDEAISRYVGLYIRPIKNK